MGRVLVIDSDAARRIALAAALGREPHEVEIAANAASGISLARMSRPDLVIVDALLEGGTSADVCGALRREPTTQAMLLIVISGSSREDDRVAAFESGADDVVTRPFSTRELLLRARALLRRVRKRELAENVVVGPVRIDRGARRVSMSGTPVALTRREFDLLLRLVDGRGRVLARETIVADVWPEDSPSERVVDTTLKRLRRKLPAIGERIRTIRGVGYELTVDEADGG